MIVHDLATGVDIERIQTEESVWDLDLSGANVVYSEGKVDSGGFVVDTRVMLVASDGSSMKVAPYGYEVLIDGDRLLWAQSATAYSGGLAADQAIMAATISNHAPMQLSRQSTNYQDDRDTGRRPARTSSAGTM